MDWRRSNRLRGLLLLVLVATCVQCSNEPAADSAGLASGSATIAATEATDEASETPTPDLPDPAGAPGPLPAAITPPSGAGEPRVDTNNIGTPTPPDSDPRTAASVVLQEEGPRVTAVVYPRPDYDGDPWSQWGQGAVLPDGRVISAIGDHLGRGGNSYIYAFDPATGVITQIGDIAESLDHPADSWGFGKVHGQMVLADDGDVYFATYWGSRRDLEFDDTYQGDVLFRLDTDTLELHSLGVPVPRHGVPSLAGDGRYLFGEALDPLSDPDSGGLFVYDTVTDKVSAWIPDDREAQFRNIIVDETGAMVASVDGTLLRYNHVASTLVESGIDLGDRLRASTPPDSNGVVYAVTNSTDEFFAIDNDGSLRSLGVALDYSTSLALLPDESAFLYVPGAHGSGPTFGTPLLAVDVDSGEQTTLVELDTMAREQLGLVLGGTFNVTVDAERGLAHIGFNAGTDEESPWGEVVQVTVELTPDATHVGAAAPAATDASATNRPTGEITDASMLTDVTDAFGLTEPLTGLHGHAVAVADVDDDGWDDIFVGTFADRPTEAYALRGADGPNPDRLLLGGPDGFQLDESFPGRLARSSGATFADLDNDGDPDLIVSRNVKNGSFGTEILRNDNGTFVSVLELDDTRGGRAVETLDYDGDGLLDIYLVEDKWVGGSSVLFRNQGDFRFVDRTRAAGLPDDIFGLGLGIADLDGNGTDDLVIGGSNRIFLGDGTRGFIESATAIADWEIFGPEDDADHVAIGDLNGDGRPDIVLGQHYNSTLDFDAKVPVRLYLNDGTDTDGNLLLTDATEHAGLIGLPTKAPKVLLVDLNDDGWLDLVTTASADNGSAPAIFYHQGVVDGIPRFAAPTGLGDAQYWIDAAIIDADRDGIDDLFLIEWEPSLPSMLFQNSLAAPSQ